MQFHALSSWAEVKKKELREGEREEAIFQVWLWLLYEMKIYLARVCKLKCNGCGKLKPTAQTSLIPGKTK